MTTAQLKKLNTFSAVCKATGKDERNYDLEKGETAADKADICLRRVRLTTKPFNDGKKADIADTSQYKYLPLVNIEKDTESPFGFRLAYYGYGRVIVVSILGARPYLLNPDHVEIWFENFREEIEQWIHWDNKANQED